MERSIKVSQAMPGFRVCTLTRCKIEDFSLLLMMLIGDLAKFSSSRVVGHYVCVDRAEEMTRGAVSGKMTQLEGLQTVKCDDDTISYDTSLSTFTLAFRSCFIDYDV